MREISWYALFTHFSSISTHFQLWIIYGLTWFRHCFIQLCNIYKYNFKSYHFIFQIHSQTLLTLIPTTITDELYFSKSERGNPNAIWLGYTLT